MKVIGGEERLKEIGSTTSDGNEMFIIWAMKALGLTREDAEALDKSLKGLSINGTT